MSAAQKTEKSSSGPKWVVRKRLKNHAGQGKLNLKARQFSKSTTMTPSNSLSTNSVVIIFTLTGFCCRHHYSYRVLGGVGSTSQSSRVQDGGKSRHAERGVSNVQGAGSSRSLVLSSLLSLFPSLPAVVGPGAYHRLVGSARALPKL